MPSWKNSLHGKPPQSLWKSRKTAPIGATILNGASSMEVLNIGPSITSIHANAFGGTPEGMIINLPVSEGAISGAPWGAPNAIINYDTPYAGTVPIPQT